MPLYFPRSQKKLVVMILATAGVLSLVITTWAMARVSAWIVGHDSVGMQMDKEGASLEHALAEIFLLAKDWYFFGIELLACAIFLGLLWHTLYRDEPNGDSSKGES